MFEIYGSKCYVEVRRKYNIRKKANIFVLEVEADEVAGLLAGQM